MTYEIFHMSYEKHRDLSGQSFQPSCTSLMPLAFRRQISLTMPCRLKAVLKTFSLFPGVFSEPDSHPYLNDHPCFPKPFRENISEAGCRG